MALLLETPRAGTTEGFLSGSVCAGAPRYAHRSSRNVVNLEEKRWSCPAMRVGADDDDTIVPDGQLLPNDFAVDLIDKRINGRFERDDDRHHAMPQ